MRLLPPTVLIDDDPRRIEVVALLLRGAFGDVRLTSVCDGVALARALHGEPVGLVVARAGLGWAPLNEVAALQRELHPDGALVVLLERPDQEPIEAALRAGAEGLVTDDASGLARLPEVVHTAVFRARRRRLGAARDLPYRSLVRAMALGAFHAAPDGTLLDANPALAQLVGVPGPEQLVRRSLPDLLTDETARSAWSEGLAGPSQAIQLTTTLRRDDGAQVPVRLSCWAIPDPNGGEPHVQGTVAAVGEHDAGSGSSAAPRPAAAEIAQLASAISHDLRQPLRVVSRSLELLAGTDGVMLGDAGDDHLERARAAAADLDRLLEGLLRWVRVPSAADGIGPVPLDRVLDRILDRLSAERQQRQAVIERGPLPTVVADEAQMELLLQNLVENALKFAGESPPQIWLAAARETGAWHLTVRDAGIGIDPATVDRVFDLFHRQPGAEATPGHGIGLAVCRRIVAGHGGRIWVESAPGAGATFHVVLPDRAEQRRDGGTR